VKRVSRAAGHVHAIRIGGSDGHFDSSCQSDSDGLLDIKERLDNESQRQVYPLDVRRPRASLATCVVTSSAW